MISIIIVLVRVDMVGDLKFCLPLHAIRHRQIGGTESSIYNLAKGLSQVSDGLTLAYSDLSRLAPEFQSWLGRQTSFSVKQTTRLPGPKGNRFIEECLFEAGRQDDTWVLYPNYFAPPALGKRKPTSVLLHDIQYKHMPEYHSYKRKAWLDFYLPKMFASVDVVFLISEFEKAQVARYFGDAAASKCTVIYNAIDFDRFDAPLIDNTEPMHSEAPYVLTVCHQFPHKNIKTLLSAFNRLCETIPKVELLLVGKQSKTNSEFVKNSLSDVAKERVRLLGYVSDAQLAMYYKHAALFALPSTYEGFGMPAIEALGLGVPTLLSNIPSLREITFNEALYVKDPLNANEWCESLSSMLKDGVDRQSLQHLGSKVRAAYKPRTVAEKVLSALRP